jgi:hypothetical protein
MPTPCPPEHDVKLALALERAKSAQARVDALEDEVTALNTSLRMEMKNGFEEIKRELAKIGLQNAARSGAEKLGAWLVGTLGAVGAIAATIWAAMQSSSHHG